MATGRTVSKHSRFYASGYDLSGYTRSFGPLMHEYDTAEEAALTDQVKGALPSHANLSPGTLNGFFDNTATSGLHVVASGAGVERVVMCPIGIRAAPIAGDPVYVGQFVQTGYTAETDPNWVYANVPFGMASTLSTTRGAYSKPWGVLLHASAAQTDVNSSAGIDDNGAATDYGGYLCYQIFSVVGAGTVTINVQDATANNDGDFGDLTGATSGAIAHGSVPAAAIVALGTTATVKRYLRWQIVLDTITSVTFALSFTRSLAPGI